MIFTDFNKILCPVEKKMRIGASMDCDVCLCDLLIAAVGFSIMVYFTAMLICPKAKAMKKHRRRK